MTNYGQEVNEAFKSSFQLVTEGNLKIIPTDLCNLKDLTAYKFTVYTLQAVTCTPPHSMYTYILSTAKDKVIQPAVKSLGSSPCKTSKTA